jgi:hypothetical protein
MKSAVNYLEFELTIEPYSYQKFYSKNKTWPSNNSAQNLSEKTQNNYCNTILKPHLYLLV